MGEWRLRKREYALDFDAANNDYAAIKGFNYGTSGLSHGLTIGCWLQTTGDAEVISAYDRSEYWRFGVGSSATSNKLSLNLYTSAIDDMASATDVNDGNLHHCVVVFDPSVPEVRFYIDGALDASRATSAATWGTGATRYGFLGDGSEASAYDGSRNGIYFSGTVDDHRVYHRALSGSEITDWYEGRSVSATDLVMRHTFDGGPATPAQDISGNDYDAAVFGATYADPLTFTEAPETQIFGGEVVDAYNRFARSAVVEMPSRGGSEVSEYPPFLPVELDVKLSDGSWLTRFGGFVTNPTTEDNSLTLELLSHDLWLRRRQVYESYDSTAISAIIEDIVKQYTPLTWDASRVSVVNDETLTRQWKGEKPAAILQELANASAGEEYGADDKGTFYFRPTETETSPRHFTQGEYTGADFDDDGKSEVNKVTVYYGQGSSSGGVSVQDRASQKELQEELGAPRPVVIEETASHPEISSEAAAERKARAILNGNVGIRTGTIDSWGAYQVNPGDVARVDVPDQDVNGDYRVAEITYDLTGGTEVRLAENAEGVTDVLVDMSQEVSRVDAKTSDTSASLLEVLPLSQDIAVETEIEIFTYSVPADQFQMGDFKGGFGDPDIGGGKLGDQRGDKTQVI